MDLIKQLKDCKNYLTGTSKRSSSVPFTICFKLDTFCLVVYIKLL